MQRGEGCQSLYRVSGAVGPILTVRELYLGTQTFVGGSKPIKIDIAGGQPINFRWSADAIRIEGLTAIGRATIIALRMNREAILATRARWVWGGWHPPDDR